MQTKTQDGREKIEKTEVRREATMRITLLCVKAANHAASCRLQRREKRDERGESDRREKNEDRKRGQNEDRREKVDRREKEDRRERKTEADTTKDTPPNNKTPSVTPTDKHVVAGRGSGELFGGCNYSLSGLRDYGGRLVS